MTKKFYGYIRVSTVKQGTHGVSLPEQRAAIQEFASRHGFEIVRWFEEKKTAAKQGRPIYSAMMRLLKKHRADGVIVHKIDRSARNFRDWAEIGDLIDAGIEVRFANEDLDMNSRGGRLAADIQAVVAADYIRNLQEEAKKGLYGRMKQGIWPFQAPLGYLDRGSGKVKDVDPKNSPLIKEAFTLYASGAFSVEKLADELYRRGLRSRRGGKLSENALSATLRNPYYIGILRVKRNGQTFAGSHEPLIETSLFNQVKERLDGHTQAYVRTNALLFRRLLSCTTCGRDLTGEIQKGHTYYRCHGRTCNNSIREEKVEGKFCSIFEAMALQPIELERIYFRLEEHKRKQVKSSEVERAALDLRMSKSREKLLRLVDLVSDKVIEEALFLEKKRQILEEKRRDEEALEKLAADPHHRIEEIWGSMQLAGRAASVYETAKNERKRELVEEVSSNRTVQQKTVVVKLRFPYFEMAGWGDPLGCGDLRGSFRSVRDLPGAANGGSEERSLNLDSLVKSILQKHDHLEYL